MSDIYTAQPKQVLFHNATADEVLYGGAAGGGKSEAILWDAVGKCLTIPDVRVSIFRRTYPELEKSIILNFLRKVPNDLYKYSKNEHRAIFLGTGGILEFNHVQYEHDVFKFQSAEYDFQYFDELTHFTESIYRYLLSRLRTTKKDLHPQIKSASNPGNIGHLWVKERFIDGVKPFEIETKVDNNADFPTTYTSQFIPAKVWDNKILTEADPNYIERLKRLPEDERRALLEGDWDVFKGQFFKEWRAEKHVIDPFEIPREWKRFRALDWGYANPSACLWFTVDQNDNVYVYRELYVAQSTIDALAKDIAHMSVYEDGKTPEKIDYTAADPSIWSVTQYERGESIAYKLVQAGIPVSKADNNRMGGWSAMHDYLYHDEKTEPTLKFFSHCKNSIRTIPALVHDERKPEDLDTTGEDHCADACRYGIMSNPSPKVHRKKIIIPKDSFRDHFKRVRRLKERSAYAGNQ